MKEHFTSIFCKCFRFMMSESYAPLDVVMQFFGTPEKPGSNFPFNFMMINDLTAESNAATIVNSIKNWYDKMPVHGWANWVVSTLIRDLVNFTKRKNFSKKHKILFEIE